MVDIMSTLQNQLATTEDTGDAEEKHRRPGSSSDAWSVHCIASRNASPALARFRGWPRPLDLGSTSWLVSQLCEGDGSVTGSLTVKRAEAPPRSLPSSCGPSIVTHASVAVPGREGFYAW